MVVNISNCSIWELEAGGSEVQSHPQLHGEFEVKSELHDTLSQHNNSKSIQKCSHVRNKFRFLSYKHIFEPDPKSSNTGIWRKMSES